MKKYEFVTIKSSKVVGAKFDEHRKIIAEHAAMGYRYVGFIPTELSDAGKIKAMDLVFETEK